MSHSDTSIIRCAGKPDAVVTREVRQRGDQSVASITWRCGTESGTARHVIDAREQACASQDRQGKA